MKKLTKVLLGASLFALLLAGCNNGGLVANDELDEADVDGYATENGVIILEWDAVKDADYYSVYVKTPYTEKYSVALGSATLSNSGFYRYVYTDAVEADSDYEFKIVAGNNSKANLLASETEITVTTPETFTDTAIFSGSDIAFTLVPNTANKYEISFPVNAGFTYSVYETTETISSAEDLWNKLNADNSYSPDAWFDGAKYITITKENDDGDDYVVDAVITDSFTVTPDGKEHYIVVRATPKNAKVATAKYVISTAFVNPSYTGTVVWPGNGSRVYDTDGKVSAVGFFADKYNYTETTAASSYRIYRETTKNTYKINATTGDVLQTGSTTTLELLGTPTLYTGTDYTYSANVEYRLPCTETADATDGSITYSYKYWAVFTDNTGLYYYGATYWQEL